MKLPNAEKAGIPPEKITDYLLSSTHRAGRGKAKYFSNFGFRRDAWETLRTALLNHAVDNEVSKSEESFFGKRYIIEGPLKTPDGRKPTIRTVWFVEKGEDIPRFVTAYPC